MNEVSEAITRVGKVFIAILILGLLFEFDPLLWSISGAGELLGLPLMAVIMVLEIGTAFEIARY